MNPVLSAYKRPRSDDDDEQQQQLNHHPRPRRGAGLDNGFIQQDEQQLMQYSPAFIQHPQQQQQQRYGFVMDAAPLTLPPPLPHAAAPYHYQYHAQQRQHQFHLQQQQYQAYAGGGFGASSQRTPMAAAAGSVGGGVTMGLAPSSVSVLQGGRRRATATSAATNGYRHNTAAPLSYTAATAGGDDGACMHLSSATSQHQPSPLQPRDAARQYLEQLKATAQWQRF
jgi:hypothetical protein